MGEIRPTGPVGRIVVVILVAVLAALGLIEGPLDNDDSGSDQQPAPKERKAPEPQPAPEEAPQAPDQAPQPDGGGSLPTSGPVVKNVTVKSFGEVVYQGDVDLRPTIAGIGDGTAERRDTFDNREGLLPDKPQGYYTEYTHPTPGVDGPGPQRIVRGDGGENYYTPDHYASFIEIVG